MPRDYEQHITDYVLRFFRHLMTDIERAADEAIVLHSNESGRTVKCITFRAGTPEAVAQAAEPLLEENSAIRRRRTCDRILASHHAEVFANACPSCGKLPATPRAKMCLWCPHTWREEG